MSRAETEGRLLRCGLQFFGKVTASASHEIKNCLAIMREQAGLVEDLLAMAERGHPLSHERLKTLTGSIHGQTERADGIVRNLSRFAHSVDEPWAKVDLVELVQLVCNLIGRLASMKGVSLVLKSPRKAAAVHTAPFSLANLVWQCLFFVLTRGGGPEKRTVELEVISEGEFLLVSFGGVDLLSEQPVGENFPGPAETALLDKLRASLEVQVDRNVVLLRLPKAAGGEELD